TTSVDLSPSGMKVRPLWAAPESAVRLSVTLPDDGERLEIVSVLIRVDFDGYAFYFTNLTGPQLERLTRLINRLSAQPTPWSAPCSRGRRRSSVGSICCSTTRGPERLRCRSKT